jgi:secreted PhoX family phosphatase
MSDHHDENCNTSNNEDLRSLLARNALTRRHLIRGGVGLAAVASLPFLAACGGGDEGSATPVAEPDPTPAETTLGFEAVSKHTVDELVLPAGYGYTVLHATGDPLFSDVPAYSNLGTEEDDWSLRIGDHHDGMELFYVDDAGRSTASATDRAVLVVNHESSADAHFFHPTGQTSNGVSGKKFSQFGNWDLGVRPKLEVLKEINHHGVSIVEVAQVDGVWTCLVDAPLNRRVTAQTPVRIAGPAAHLTDIHAFMVTAYDPSGATARGTLNNCGHGRTPWGTYLACEENWAFYFNMPSGSAAVDSKTSASRARYGVARAPLSETATSGLSQGWYTVTDPGNQSRFDRWNVAAPGTSAAEDYRNEPNTFGYLLEIDPLSGKTPVKRVAFGRFAHEAAVCSHPVAGQPLAFYMGDDSRNEYIYKFVTAAPWDEADVGGGITAGDKYLDEGRLYVAKFNADGTGQWIELNITNPLIDDYATYSFANQADVLVNARHAADAVGATKMDRPEWGAINPKNGDIYITLTNNSSSNRTPTKVDAANPRAYADADGVKSSGNPNGHIIRFKEDGGLSTATSFVWDIFLFGAEEDSPASVNLSGLTAANDFSSPDGLWFSYATGICWIQTDDGAYTDTTNCMLLAALPGAVGDGRPVTVENAMTVSGSLVTGTQDTFVGAALGDTRLRRFMVAPKGAEVTGLTESADGKALFVNIQHPGENTPALGAASAFNFESQWPGNVGYGVPGRPRSATIVITKDDGGVIGS